MSNKINKKVLAFCLSVVAVTSVFTGCTNQHNGKVEKNTISSHYSGDDCINEIKNDEQAKTITLYEYEKKNILAETSLSSRIGDVVELPANVEYASDSISAMNGKYDSTIKDFENGKAVIRGIAYVDTDGKFKTTWKEGIEQQDLNTSYNDNGYELIAYALSDVNSNTVKAWMAFPNGMYLVQDQLLVSMEPKAPDSEFKYKDSYEWTENYNDKLGLHSVGNPYIISK